MLLKAVVGSKHSLSAIIETTRWRPSAILMEPDVRWVTSVPGCDEHAWQDTLLGAFQLLVFDPGSVTFQIPEGAFCSLAIGNQGSAYLNAVWSPDKKEIAKVPRRELLKIVPYPNSGAEPKQVEVVPSKLPKPIMSSLHFLVKDTRISLLRSGRTVNVFQAGVYAPSPEPEVRSSFTLLEPFDVISFGGSFALLSEAQSSVSIKLLKSSLRA